MFLFRATLRTSLVVAAVLFTFSSFAAAEQCSSASKTKAGCAAAQSTQSETASACCSSSRSAQTSSAETEADIDSKVLKKIYTAAASGDFSQVEACPVTRKALLRLSQGHEHTSSMVRTAEQKSDYSNVAACKVTRGEISDAVVSYALSRQDVCSDALQTIQQAALIGDFSKVAASEHNQALLKKVVLATPDFHQECKDKVMEVVEGVADFSLVAACEMTRAEIDRAVKAYRNNAVSASLAN